MQPEFKFLPFRNVAVIGAGTMGAQIAAHLANAGLKVLLLDIPAKEGKKNAIVEGAFKKILKLKPNPFSSKAASKRITLGNFDEHFDALKDAEWIIEAIIENLEIKRALMERLEAVVSDDAIITTNTSGLPIHQISEGRSETFKKRFFGTHFFNPPRYLKLLEIIPTPDTDETMIQRIKWFGRVHLGKSAVIAKDTPNFIANRIGNYATLQAMRAFTEGDYTIEEIDTLTGPIVGHAKSATFRTCDVVGLDTLLYVADNLYEAIPNDESREAHKAPGILRNLVEKGMLGQKTRSGFYKKVGKDILSVNPESFEFEPAKEMNLGDVKAVWKSGGLKKRLQVLYADEGRAGEFTRSSNLDVIGYCARRVPEIADNPADIDRAICWGFSWQMGPFEVWDAIGFTTILNDMRSAGIEVPAWVDEMEAAGIESFYRDNNGKREAYVPGSGYAPLEEPADVIHLSKVAVQPDNTLISRREAALLDLGDGVALYEFRSKANSLGHDVIEGLNEAIDYVENDPNLLGMVIGNEGKNFSVGANLGEVAFAVQAGEFEIISNAIKGFQNAVMRVRYARKPIVTAVHGMTLGGACEIAMHSSNVVAALETYIGLVELGAGLIPAGCGTTFLAARASEQAPNEFPSSIQPFLFNYFQMVGTAKVATSAHEAVELGYLGEKTRVVMNADRRIYVAKEEVLRLANEGYLPPPVRNSIMVLGKEGRAALNAAAFQMQQAGYASEYDQYLAEQLAYIMCGGDITGPTAVHEQYLLELEHKVFFDLLKQPKTQERIHSILTTNKPLRN